MHQKPFGGWASPGPAGGVNSALPDPLAGLRGWSRGRGERNGVEGKGGKVFASVKIKSCGYGPGT